MPDLDYNPDKQQLSPEEEEQVHTALSAILEHCEREDSNSRLIQIKEAKQLDHFWNGLQHIFWDRNQNDWRIPTHEQIREVVGNDEYAYDYIINIFKAHGESIIAALSADLPHVGFSPDNADLPLDIQTAKAATHCAQMIQKYNESTEIFLHALFTLFTGHLVACYNHYERDSSYGMTTIPKYEPQDVQTSPDLYSCETCGASFGEEVVPICPNCQTPTTVTPGQMEKLPVEVGKEDVAKGMEKLSIRGVLDIKIPIYAKNQEGCGYLIEYSDLHYAYVSSSYGKEVTLDDKDNDSYERSMRSPSIRQGYAMADSQYNLVTVKRAWFRPWLFDLDDIKETKDLLHTKFPKGVRYDSVGKKFLSAIPDELDAHWTIAKPGPSRTVHSVPLGQPLVPVQEMRNTLKNVEIETVERGIPFTFASPKTLDFEKFQETEVGVGQYFQGNLPPSGRMGDAFYETKSATLSKEVPEVEKSLDGDAQFVVGSFPSIFGGPQGSGKTLGEYINSRNYALQRLSIPWQYISVWWGRVMYKSVNSYFAHQLEDDYFVQSEGDVFRNIWIRKADTAGKFRLLQPEVSTDFPVSIAQKRNLYMSLVELNNPDINEVLFSPENQEEAVRVVGLPNLKFPGAQQASKQRREIELLIKSDPIIPEVPPEQLAIMQSQGMEPPEQSSVPIEPEIDDDEVHIRELVSFLSSNTGQDLKEIAPNRYKNCILHLVEHKQHQEVLMMQQAVLQPQTEEEVPSGI